jgi:lipopolysaccharide transport system ATP-binding protein
MEDKPEAVMDYYNALIAEKEDYSIALLTTDEGKTQSVSGSGEAGIETITLVNLKGESIEIVRVGETIGLKIKVYIYAPIDSLVVGYAIKDRLGQVIFGTNTHQMGSVIGNLDSKEVIEFIFWFQANLGAGTYSIAIALHQDRDHVEKNFEWRDLATIFTVIPSGESEFIGSSWIPPTLDINR